MQFDGRADMEQFMTKVCRGYLKAHMDKQLEIGLQPSPVKSR